MPTCKVAQIKTLLLACVALLLTCANAACRDGQARKNVDKPLSIIASADTHGWIMPCGCTSNQSGGLARRGTVVERARKQGDMILVDVGGAAGGASRYDQMKFAAIVAGEVAMQVDAHNLGASELQLGANELRRLGEETHIPWVSCNVSDQHGHLLFPELRVIERAGRRVAIIGIVSPRYSTEELHVVEPRAAVIKTIGMRRREFDAVVVLAYAPTDELTSLAEQLPEVDIVVGGPTLQSIPPRFVGANTLLAAVTNKGKFLARFDAPQRGTRAPWQGSIVELDGTLPDDAAQVVNLNTYRERLAAADVPAAETGMIDSLGLSASRNERIAGTAACRECHPAEAAVWDASKHSHAWKTLEASGWQVDALCQRCHTTGFGLPGGFVSAGRTAEMGAVGCECCHGPAAAHARDPKTIHTLFAASQQCMQCHDRENSPQFDYAKYWPNIAHGRSARHDTSPTKENGVTP